MTKPRTIIQKIWDNHVVASEEGKPTFCTSTCTWSTRSRHRRRSKACGWPARKVRRPDLTLATVDHNVPTIDRDKPWTDPLSVQQVEVLRKNCEEFGVPLFGVGDIRQGIVHVIGPERGSRSRA